VGECNVNASGGDTASMIGKHTENGDGDVGMVVDAIASEGLGCWRHAVGKARQAHQAISGATG
jgi:hypothetical protein